jgi:CDP-glucose 4,6-dehydratase
VKNVLITGASGFLGLHLSRALKAEGCSITTLVHQNHKTDQDIFDHYAYGDLADFKWDSLLNRHRIDTVFHLGAVTEIAVGKADPVGTFETNVRGTWNLLDACRRQKTPRVICSSSDKAYGRATPPYREDSQLLPDRPYESSKAMVDLLCKTYQSTYGMGIATTRCVNLYGPECESLFTLVPNVIRKILKGERPVIRNGGKMRRDWLYIADAVDAYLRLARSDYVGPLNVGGGVGVETIKVVHTILSLMKSNLEPIDEVDTHGEITDQWTDASVAREVLGWHPGHTLEQGLVKTIAWYREYFKC